MNYKVSDSSLASVANAIRTKGGTSEQLEFPSGFVSAIGNIPSGGSSPLVRGTFTGSSAEKGSQKNISLSYSGSGYPIAGIIYPSVGANKSGSDISVLAQQYAIVQFAFSKADISATPDYDDNTEKNYGAVMVIYKNNSEDATKYSSTYSITARTYNSAGASTPGNNVARFKDATTLSVFIANDSYGFKDGIEYTYEIIYSS